MIRQYKNDMISRYNVRFSKQADDILKRFSNSPYEFRRKTLIDIVSKYLSAPVESSYNQLLRAYILIVSTLGTDHDNSSIIRRITYNRVLCEVINDDECIKTIQSFCKDCVKIDVDNSIIFRQHDAEYIAINSTKANISSETSADEYTFKIMNNKIYFVLPQHDINVMHINGVEYSNYFGNKSVLIPIHKSENVIGNSLKGKDWIKEYLYEDTTGYLYFIELLVDGVKTYKVGITKNGVAKRFVGLPNNISITTYKEVQMNMLECAVIERYIHYKFHDVKDTTLMDYEFEGKTECYHNDIYDYFKTNTSTILDESIQYLGSINYPIKPSYILETIKERYAA